MTHLTINEQNILNEIDKELKCYPDSDTMYLTNICYEGRKENKQIRAILVSLQTKGLIKLFKHNGEQLVQRIY